MNQAETKRFEELYRRHLTLLKLQGKSQKTIDAYSRAIRRARDHFGCCPDKITPKQFESYFAKLVDTHSWSTVMPSSSHCTLYPFNPCNGKRLPHRHQ